VAEFSWCVVSSIQEEACFDSVTVSAGIIYDDVLGQMGTQVRNCDGTQAGSNTSPVQSAK